MDLLPKPIHVVCLMSGECVVVSRSSQNVNNCTHTMGCIGKHVFTPSPISNVPIWSWFQLFLLWHTQKMLLSASKVNIATDIDINFQHSCQLKPENRFVNMKRTSRPNSWSSAERWANSFHCLTPICHLGEIVPRFRKWNWFGLFGAWLFVIQFRLHLAWHAPWTQGNLH